VVGDPERDFVGVIAGDEVGDGDTEHEGEQLGLEGDLESVAV
jgi:hypothetical protein